MHTRDSILDMIDRVENPIFERIDEQLHRSILGERATKEIGNCLDVTYIFIMIVATGSKIKHALVPDKH